MNNMSVFYIVNPREFEDLKNLRSDYVIFRLRFDIASTNR